MDPNCTFLPIHAYAGACYATSNGHSQRVSPSESSSVSHLSSKPSSTKNAKNTSGPIRVGRRKEQRLNGHAFHSGMGGISGSTGASSGSSCPPGPPQLPAQVQRRNERERNRVRQLNSGFSTLREHVPNGAKNKKMSKVETLRCALEYIAEMKALLAGHDPEFASSTSYQNAATVADPASTSGGSMESPISEANNSEDDFGAADSFGEFSGNFGHLVFHDETSPVSASDFVKSEEDFPWI